MACRDRRRAGRGRRGGRDRGGGAQASGSRPREHAEVRGGDPAHEPRHLLGRRGHGGLVAGRLPFHLRPRGRLLRRIPAGGDVGPAAGPRVKFLRAAGRQVLGLFVGDWLQSGVVVVILAAGWFAVSRLGAPALALIVLLLPSHLVLLPHAESHPSDYAWAAASSTIQ